MVTSTTRLVDRLKETAVKVGTEGVRMVVEGTVTATKMMDRLQEMLPDWERVVREPGRGDGQRRAEEPALERPVPARPVRSRRPTKTAPPEARATAKRVLAEVEAVQERIKEARPARRPLKARAATSSKRATAKPGLKAKRGQKHRH